MIIVNVHEAKTHFSRLIRRAHAGEEIIVAKAGKPMARLVPLEERKERVPGRYAGSVPESFYEGLPESELEAWEKPCIAYREKYLGSDPTKRRYYNMITSTLEEYRKAPSIEKAMYETDPQYGNFPKKLRAIAHALRTYLETGSLDELASLEAKNVIEKWRLYDLLSAFEAYAKEGNIKPLRTCFEGFLPDAILEEVFSRHTQELKQLFGTEEAIKARVGEYLAYIESKKYRGYQKRAQ